MEKTVRRFLCFCRWLFPSLSIVDRLAKGPIDVLLVDVVPVQNLDDFLDLSDVADILEVDDEVDSIGNDRVLWIFSGTRRHVLKSQECVLCAIAVDRTASPTMAGRPSIHQRQGFPATDLADDDADRCHAQDALQEIVHAACIRCAHLHAVYGTTL